QKGEPTYEPLGPVYPKESTGRRTALARWITDPANPLTARNAVNHIWRRHFGVGLAPRMFDLGRNAPPPSNEPLLNWLAVEFIQNGWSMKKLHRLIVLSRAYRSASGAATPELETANSKIDSENRLLWRANQRRMEAEVVRDAVLAVAGMLDAAHGGPDLDYALGMTSPRRSVYFRNAREKQMMFLQIFDGADVNECYQRDETIAPQQSLAMLNSPLTRAAAERLAGTIGDPAAESTRETDAAFVAAAFRTVLGRTPSSTETTECLRYLTTTESTATPAARLRSRANVLHVLMNHHDFVTIR
ncbi:MAG: DUF1553 domain-containing protein, partial [Planctomycetia bacterium]